MEGVPTKILGRATLIKIDFILNFSMCSADLTFLPRIHDSVSVTPIAFND